MDDAAAPAATVPLRELGGGLVSALPEGDEGAPYDRHAEIYDRLIGNRRYNQLIWGCDPREYATFAAEALAAGDGPFLDAGSGTAVFTADLYRRASRPVVLVDRSTGMLRKAAERLDGAPVTLVQADLFALPFSPQTFSTVGCFAMLHVLDEPWDALARLRSMVAPGGQLYASMLVVDRRLSRHYHRMLERRGEMGPPRRAAELASVAGELFTDAQVTRTGAMAWLRAVAAP
jgi:SAM-dependent methyltransferase